MRLVLPKTREERWRAVEAMLGPAIEMRARKLVWWRIVSCFLQGARSFKAIDYSSGDVVAYYHEDEEARVDEYFSGIPFRVDRVINKVRTEIGRLLRLDLDPAVRKQGSSLQSLRNSSLSTAILDHQKALVDTEGVDHDFISHLVRYGTAGLGHWREEIPGTALGYEWEMIPAWELLSFPAETEAHSQERAFGRIRFVPMSTIERLPFRMPSGKDVEKLEIVELPYGSGGERSLVFGGGEGGGHRSSLYEDTSRQLDAARRPRGRGRDEKGVERFVRLLEIYTRGPNGSVLETLTYGGRWELDYQDLRNEDVLVPSPIGTSRYIDIGRFYGEDFPRMVIPLGQRLEMLLCRLANGAMDLDRFGFFFYPFDLGINKEDFKDTIPPRAIGYERDITGTLRDPVFNVQPATVNDFPGRVAMALSEQLDKDSAQGPAFEGEAAGRIDSSVGLRTLAEVGSTGLLPTAKSIGSGYSTVYRSMLYQARQMLATETGRQEVIQLLRMDNTMAGISVDPETGQLRLSSSQIPSPWEVEISIASEEPYRRAMEREEALMSLNAGTLTILDFTIENYKKNWGYDLGPAGRKAYAAYCKAVFINLVLFNDGEQPGAASRMSSTPGFVDPQTSAINPNDAFDPSEVHLLATEEFVAPPEFALASDAVQDVFRLRLEALRDRQGEPLPAGAPTMQQAAADQMARMAPQPAQG